ncbi:MAG TPA: adenylate/guanylate cyclase domain-containing protein [Chitinophagaceae bacterium]|nr:adenylate/guanylate cyclase domain-containing protein [Chitinophagaceae bacterium]
MRRLSAIMFTDMVGYSALTQENEELALELLAEHRTILRPFFAKHEGREIETAGDSFFVEFNSAVEAATCAIEIQTTLNQRNASQPKQRHILLRIGLHIGDVVYMDKHVHGDGVNIAARLEPLAQPGGICVSEDVARQIRNKVSYPVVKIGEETLKNISMPMEIYCVALPWAAQKLRSPRSKRVPWQKIAMYSAIILLVVLPAVYLLFLRKNEAKAAEHSKLRMAVLPLKNISDNVQDEYFADGMTEELISSLSKIGGLNVIARTSTMKYKSTNKDILQIGRELMVGTILEGSVRKIGNKARITVQLVDVASQEHIWSMDYDRELKDIFTIQSEIAKSIAGELKVRLVPAEQRQLEKSNTNNTVAFQEYLVGKHYLNQRTSEGIHKALTHFEESIKADPQFALPYTSMAYAYTLIGAAGYGNIPRSIAEGKARTAVMKALEIDSTLAEAHAALGYIKFRIDWDWKGAEKEFQEAIKLKPGYATAHEWYALFLAVSGRLDEALKEMHLAYELDPLAANVGNGLARIYYFREEFDKSLEQTARTMELDPEYAEGHFTAAMTYMQKKEYDKSEAELKKAIELSGRRPVMVGMMGALYGRQGRIEEAKAILSELQAGPPNNDKLYAIAMIKSHIGEVDESFNIFDKLMDEKYGILIYMKVQRDMFPQLASERYEQLIKKLGL